MPPAMTSSRGTMLSALTRELARPLQRFGRDSDGLIVSLPGPSKLRAQTERLASLFEQGAPPAPPLQQRINALARLRRGDDDLSRREWNLVAWGLCDDCGACGLPIEEQPLFDTIMAHVDNWIITQDVPRKSWFGLLNSYFSYPRYREQGTNWLMLRQKLIQTLPILIDALKRPKLWSRMLVKHSDILSDEAWHTLHHTIFFGSDSDRIELDAGLPIPEASWLWHRIVAHQIDYINSLADADFMRVIPPMLEFLRTRPLYADHLVAALLTRYCQSSSRMETHEQLKNESFTRWGNPQLRSSSRWANVEQTVRNMVLRWFAKDDLEHFFSLLQGNGQVDQARLRYWLRFVDQISYTRILLGADAVVNQDPEFRNFRAKNAGRCGQLTAGPSHNNAFVMRINDHYIVEFSGTGNACYAYAEQQLPFSPDAKVHTVASLKRKLRNASGDVINRISHQGGWQWNADQFLAHRGIRPGVLVHDESVKVQSYQPHFTSPEKPATRAESHFSATPLTTVALMGSAAIREAPDRGNAVTPTTTSAKSALQRAVEIASELARINDVKVLDNRSKGGAFWVLSSDSKSVLGRELVQLGMSFNPGKGFWIK